jgi:hypothetical protein
VSTPERGSQSRGSTTIRFARRFHHNNLPARDFNGHPKSIKRLPTLRKARLTRRNGGVIRCNNHPGLRSDLPGSINNHLAFFNEQTVSMNGQLASCKDVVGVFN